MKKISDLTFLQKILEGACFAILAGMFLGLFVFWGRIPDQIPGHYNGAGEIDRWGSKFELLILPVVGVFMYLFISACCALLWEPIRKGELPLSACTWLTGTKLVVLGTFAVIEWCSACARPMAGWLTPVSLMSCGVLMTGIMISSIGFALRQKK